MTKISPNWGLWKHVRDVNAKEAVALTLNVEPRSSAVATASEYSDRLFLIERVHGASIKLTLVELAKWAQSVGWNIPVELGALAPAPRPTYAPAPANIVAAAIDKVIAPGERASELLDALLAEGWRFAALDSGCAIHIPDSTVQGAFVPLSHLYTAVSNLCLTTKNNRIPHLVRASGASGGGAMPSPPPSATDFAPPAPSPLPVASGSPREQLIALADQVANDVRGSRAKVGVNEICKLLETDAYYEKYKDLLTTQKGPAKKSWMLSKGLGGWTDPLIRSENKPAKQTIKKLKETQ